MLSPTPMHCNKYFISLKHIQGDPKEFNLSPLTTLEFKERPEYALFEVSIILYYIKPYNLFIITRFLNQLILYNLHTK